MTATNRNTITIPAPIANPGDKVEVINYRKKKIDPVWETGQVVRVQYRNDTLIGKWRWTYAVILDRKTCVGSICLGASDSSIRLLSVEG